MHKKSWTKTFSSKNEETLIGTIIELLSNNIILAIAQIQRRAAINHPRERKKYRGQLGDSTAAMNS